MTNVIDLTKITGRTDFGYTQGLPLGISVVDSLGAIAPIVTTVAPTSSIIGGTLPTGIMYYNLASTALSVYNGTSWVSVTINT